MPAEALECLPIRIVRMPERLSSLDGNKVTVPPSPHMLHNARTDIAVVLCSRAILPLLCTHKTIAGHPAQLQGVQIEAPCQSARCQNACTVCMGQSIIEGHMPERV